MATTPFNRNRPETVHTRRSVQTTAQRHRYCIPFTQYPMAPQSAQPPSLTDPCPLYCTSQCTASDRVPDTHLSLFRAVSDHCWLPPYFVPIELAYRGVIFWCMKCNNMITWTHAWTHACACTHEHTNSHAYPSARLPARTRAPPTHTPTRPRAHTHTHTHTCTLKEKYSHSEPDALDYRGCAVGNCQYTGETG